MRPRTRRGETFEIRHGAHPLGADYDIDENGCWIWRWSKTPDGYPNALIEGKIQKVHRWIISDLLTPEKPCALHKPVICHNRACINREHLYAGTLVDNSYDRNKDGTHYMGFAKLSDEQVLDIYRRAHSGERHKGIAREYGINVSTVSHIKMGDRWHWLTSNL